MLEFKYPYTDTSVLNLDWFLEQFKLLVEEWKSTEEKWAEMQQNFQTLESTVQTFTTFVENYFENLDVQQEINNKLDQMALDGTLSTLLAPLVDDKLPDVVDDKLPAELASQLPAEVTSQLPGVVADQIDAAVAPGIPDAVTDWLDDNVDPVGSAVTIDSSLTIAGSAADALVVGDDIRDLQGVFDTVEGYNKWNLANPGKYINASGGLSNNVAYDTCDFFAAEPGDIVRLQFDYNGIRYDSVNEPGYLKIAFIAAYDSNKDYIANSLANAVTSYTCPAGTAYVRACLSNTSNPNVINRAIFIGADDTIIPYEPYYIKKVIKAYDLPIDDNSSSPDKIWSAAGCSELSGKTDLLSAALNSNMTIGKVNSDSTIDITVPQTKKNVILGYIGFFGSWSDLEIYQGKTSGFTGRLCKITSTDIELYRMDQAQPYFTAAHGLTLSTYISVLIAETEPWKARIYLSSNGASYTTAETSWDGSRKNILVEHGGNSWTNIVSFGSADFLERTWIFGDSYLDHWGRKVLERGYTRFMEDGYSGGTSANALASFELAITMGCPRTVVWCLGMNDPDSGAINSDYKDSLDQVKTICDQKGIHLIVVTVPNVPSRDNSYKNTYVRANFDYIDVATLVGSENDVHWYSGLLSADEVHPSSAGDFYIANIMQTYLPDLRNS